MTAWQDGSDGGATTLIAGTVGGAALLAGEAIAARGRRYAKPTMGLALRTSMGPSLGPVAAPGPARRLGRARASASSGWPTRSAASSPGCWPRAARRPGERHVLLSSVGVAGSRSTDLATQVARALLGDRPDVAVVLIGANDATGLRRPGRGRRPPGGGGPPAARGRRPGRRRHLPRSGRGPVDRRRRCGRSPGWLGRRMARAQAGAVIDAGGTVVDLGDETGPVFRADAGTLCYDGFHPSADGYRVWAHALFPAVAQAALRLRPPVDPGVGVIQDVGGCH